MSVHVSKLTLCALILRARMETHVYAIMHGYRGSTMEVKKSKYDDKEYRLVSLLVLQLVGGVCFSASLTQGCAAGEWPEGTTCL